MLALRVASADRTFVSNYMVDIEIPKFFMVDSQDWLIGCIKVKMNHRIVLQLTSLRPSQY